MARDYRLLCSEYLLRELAKYNPLIRENLAAETAQDAQNQECSSAEDDGSVKRRRIIDDDEQKSDVDMAVVHLLWQSIFMARHFGIITGF